MYQMLDGGLYNNMFLGGDEDTVQDDNDSEFKDPWKYGLNETGV